MNLLYASSLLLFFSLSFALAFWFFRLSTARNVEIAEWVCSMIGYGLTAIAAFGASQMVVAVTDWDDVIVELGMSGLATLGCASAVTLAIAARLLVQGRRVDARTNSVLSGMSGFEAVAGRIPQAVNDNAPIGRQVA